MTSAAQGNIEPGHVALKPSGAEQAPLRWFRSARSGNLFLVRGNRRLRVGCVYTRRDGLFGWKAGGTPCDDIGLPTEEDAIEALYATLGL